MGIRSSYDSKSFSSCIGIQHFCKFISFELDGVSIIRRMKLMNSIGIEHY